MQTCPIPAPVRSATVGRYTRAPDTQRTLAQVHTRVGTGIRRAARIGGDRPRCQDPRETWAHVHAATHEAAQRGVIPLLARGEAHRLGQTDPTQPQPGHSSSRGAWRPPPRACTSASTPRHRQVARIHTRAPEVAARAPLPSPVQPSFPAPRPARGGPSEDSPSPTRPSPGTAERAPQLPRLRRRGGSRGGRGEWKRGMAFSPPPLSAWLPRSSACSRVGNRAEGPQVPYPIELAAVRLRGLCPACRSATVG